MNGEMTHKVIAHIRTGFPTKFGVPRQSGLVQHTLARIEFTPEYRNADALRGIEAYSHLWLIWQFSESVRDTWSPTVRPPRLGGNSRMGVFATRSPFRPNALGLSSVALERVEWDTPCGAVLWVRGADLMDNTPIYDIKPYLPYTDSHPAACGGFAEEKRDNNLEVQIPVELLEILPADERQTVIELLEQDPRPAYQRDETRIYGFVYAGYEIRFKVKNTVATVVAITKEAP